MCVRAGELVEYPNLRYGFVLSYPAGFVVDVPPENGDGRRFRMGECEILAFGSNNVLNETLRSREREHKQDFSAASHRTGGPNWVQMSGVKGDRHLTIRIFVGPKAINEVWVIQPRAGTGCRVNDKLVMQKFKPGPLNEAR